MDEKIELEQAVKRLKEIITIQCADGTWNYDPYQFGLANGLILALAILENKEPKFLEAPDKWLEDMDGVVSEPMPTSYETVDGRWWEFVGGVAVRPLSDKEAAEVIWG